MKIEKKEVSEMSREELINENKEVQIKYNNLILEINNLKWIVFGSKREDTPTTESINTDQCSFFDNEEDIEKDVQEQTTKQIEEITMYRKKNSKKRVASVRKPKRR